MHSENGIWATLFGLLLWEALFAPVPDVLRHPFQNAPLDLNDADSFYGARQVAAAPLLFVFARRRAQSFPHWGEGLGVQV